MKRTKPKIQVMTTFGKNVEILTIPNICRALVRNRTEFGWSWLYCEQTMTAITRWRDGNKGLFTYTVDELDFIYTDVLAEILTQDFVGEKELDEAAQLFLQLLKNPLKKAKEEIRKKMLGPWKFLNIPQHH